jgi:hypothetical protein
MMCSLGYDDGGDGGGAGLEHTPARPGIQQPIAENTYTLYIIINNHIFIIAMYVLVLSRDFMCTEICGGHAKKSSKWF